MVFVYGTLKKGQPNYHHFDNPENGKAKFIARGHTEVAYPLIIATRWNLPFLLFAPGKGTIVEGEIYDVDSTMMSWMDDFEGHPEVYQREKIRIVTVDNRGLLGNNSGKKVVECWVYFLKKFPPGLLNLSAMSSYDTAGEHGKYYKEDEDLSGPDTIYEALQEECQCHFEKALPSPIHSIK